MQLNDFVQLTADLGMDRLIILNLHLASFTFEYVQDCNTYDETVSKVNEVSVKPKNVIFSSVADAGRQLTTAVLL
ncbi:hypothetical protein T11_16290 [Trichinella zimbabwensis]|uniref:Uncharacterized protein n=2 Tax=Trichinella zimbabwensis TaxID=268475 RepID=A0A0V1GXX6_9BILA|nr:hypothetical protein T11_16290 [Trichinella zimbabwensis]